MSNESIVVSIEKGEERRQVVKYADVQPGQYFKWSSRDLGVNFRTTHGFVRMNNPCAGEHCAYNHAGSGCILTDRDGNPLTEPVEDTVVVRMTRSVAESVAATHFSVGSERVRAAIRDALIADGES